MPSDVSKDFLEQRNQLRADYPDVQITPVVSDITEPFALPAVASHSRCLLGSTIGNFPREQAVRFSHTSPAKWNQRSIFARRRSHQDPAVITVLQRFARASRRRSISTSSSAEP